MHVAADRTKLQGVLGEEFEFPVYLFPQSLPGKKNAQCHLDQDLANAGLEEPFFLFHDEKSRGTSVPTATVEHVTIDGQLQAHLRYDPSLRGPLFTVINANAKTNWGGFLMRLTGMRWPMGS